MLKGELGSLINIHICLDWNTDDIKITIDGKNRDIKLVPDWTTVNYRPSYYNLRRELTTKHPTIFTILLTVWQETVTLP